jgi:sporulation protein YlmC with PRC-barrel domain
MNASWFAGMALAVATATTPAFAQSTPNTAGGANAPATPPAGGMTANPAPSPTAPGAMGGNAAVNPPPSHNPVLTESGEVRASKVVGSSVYNDRNEKVGTVDDILMSKDQKADTAVISVGGFLGIGSKLVSVPYDKLQFNETVDSNTGRVLMPDATKDSLNGMPEFHYAGNG